MSKGFFFVAALLLTICFPEMESAPPSSFDVSADDAGDHSEQLPESVRESLIRHKRQILCNPVTGDRLCGSTCKCGGSCRNGVCTCYRQCANNTCPRPNGVCPSF